MKSYGLKTVVSERKMKDFFGHLVQERDSQIQQLRDEVRSLQEKCQAARGEALAISVTLLFLRHCW